MDDKKIDSDKYKGKAIRFYDKKDHYELIFTDEFNHPTSGAWTDKEYTVITDIVEDLKNADKSKELHIFIASYGGEVDTLGMLIQQIKSFDYSIAINMGYADSCGFMLFMACDEQYTSPYGTFMYHEPSTFEIGKVKEIECSSEFLQEQFELLLDQTKVRKILTQDQLILGETSQVWFSGQALIDTGKVFSIDKYYTRKIPKQADNKFIKIDSRSVYEYANGQYIRYVKSGKPCKYSTILNNFNKLGG